MTEFDLPEGSLCPCGEESLVTGGGLHVLGANCRERVAKHVRRRFGSHRFGGRYAADVEDLIQDCYRNLLTPGGIKAFQPPVDRERGDAFRAWLWTVVHYHCNNKTDYFRVHPEVGGDTLDRLPESLDASTPEQEFARKRILDIVEVAVAAIQPSWRAKGPKWSERFEVLVALVTEQTDTKRARERLCIEDNHLRQLKHTLEKELESELRKQVLDDLPLPAGLDDEGIELRIDEEIRALFQAAYPGRDVMALFSSEPKPAPDPKDEPEPEATDEPMESKR